MIRRFLKQRVWEVQPKFYRLVLWWCPPAGYKYICSGPMKQGQGTAEDMVISFNLLVCE